MTVVDSEPNNGAKLYRKHFRLFYKLNQLSRGKLDAEHGADGAGAVQENIGRYHLGDHHHRSHILQPPRHIQRGSVSQVAGN